ISTSLISGAVRANSSEDSDCRGKSQKNRKAVMTLSTTMTPKFFTERLRVSISLMAKDSPIPSIGPINGDISIAPITTAVELALSPTEAIKIEQMRIQEV